jgi:uncharacterized protein (DUF433 family)
MYPEKEIIEMYKAGFSINQISARYSIFNFDVEKIIKTNNVKS